MAYSIDTKPNLTDSRFEQCVGDLLILSGCTDVHGKFEISSGGTLSVLPNRGTNKMLISDSVGNVTLQQEIPESNVTNLISDLAGKTSVIKFNTYTGTTAPATYVPYTMINDSKTYTGFVDPANVTISYNWSGRTITLSGNLTYMWRGVEHTLTSPWTSNGHTTSTGNWYLASTDGVNFVWSRSAWNFYEIGIASVNYRATSEATFGNRESHGLEDWRVHEELHHTIGTWLSSGGLATAGSYTENLATDAAVSPSFDVAVIEDEDLPTTIPLLNKANGYTLMNIGTGSTSVYTLGAVRPFLSAGVNQYIYVNNILTGGMTAGVSTRWYNVYQILVPVTSDVNSQKYRTIFLQPQVTFTSLAAAQAEDTKGLSLGNLSTSSIEYVLHARISYASSNGNSNYGRVTIPTGGITYVVGTRMSQTTVNGVSASNHANLSNLNWVDSGHIGTNSSVAAFDSVGNAVTILQSALTPTANNGLNVIGSNIRLGGALTGNTAITGAYTLNICSGAQLNTMLGYQISGSTILRTSPNSITNVFIGMGAGNNTTTGTNNTASGYQALYGNTTGCNNNANGFNALYSNTCGCNNNASGYLSLYSNTIGNNNNAFGYCTLPVNVCGCNNTAIGLQALFSNTCGCNNIASGYQALYYNITGNNNTASGYRALLCNTTGCNNIANGYMSLYRNTGGTNNIALGYSALYCNTKGINNTAFGCQALYNNTTGCYNTALGYLALYSNTCGCNNFVVGYQALRNNTTGNNNTASGYYALYSNTGGTDNIASGYYSLNSNTCGNNNTAIGSSTLRSNTKGHYNVAFGYQILFSNTCGCNNIGIGNQSLYANTTGINNIGIGNSTLRINTVGTNNIALGNTALYSNTGGTNNIALGNNALRFNTCGNHNIASGYQALYSNKTGCYNTASGYYALRNNTCGNHNIASGYQALYSNTGGTDNFASGQNALYYNTKGSYNIANGYHTLFNNLSGSYNVAIGYKALCCNTSGCNNVAIGNNALSGNKTGNKNFASGCLALNSNSTGSENTAIGAQALSSNTIGNYNVAIGSQALNSNTGGTDNVAIGFNAMLLSSKGKNNVAIGNQSLFCNNCGCDNIAFGWNALYNNSKGCNNIAIGCRVLYNNTGGTNNIGLGYNALCNNSKGCNNIASGCFAGFSNVTGSTSIFLGTCAGYNETKSNRLYISSGATRPLIYGEFDNRKLIIDGSMCVTKLPTKSTETNIVYIDSVGKLSSGATSSGGGQQTKFSVNQGSHSLSVGNIIKSTGANTYGKAQADSSANSEVVGIVTVVTDSSNFTYVTHGIIETGVPAQVAGTVMFLSATTPGGLSTSDATEGQISKPLMVILENNTKALFNNFRGQLIAGASPASTPAIGSILYLYNNYGGF